MTTLGPCQGSRHADARRQCGRQAVVERQGRRLCAECDAQHRGGRNARVGAKRAGKREHAHATGQTCDLARRQRPCEVCDARPKRGPGRPPLDPDQGETPKLTVRLTLSGFARLRAIIDSGEASTLAEAARWAIENVELGGPSGR